MVAVPGGGTVPGWRDFERATALALGGISSENKDVFDVRLIDPSRSGVYFGISCKMRGELDRTLRTGRVTIELSNAARAFWDVLESENITQENFRSNPSRVGRLIIDLVSQWHSNAGIHGAGNVDVAASYHLALMWNKQGEYKLYQFPIELPDPSSLRWYCPDVKRRGKLEMGNSIRGDDGDGTLFEWYGQSGGQLKYYPSVDDAIWESTVFHLEPLPAGTPDGLLSKAQSYFPDIWPG